MNGAWNCKLWVVTKYMNRIHVEGKESKHANIGIFKQDRL